MAKSTAAATSSVTAAAKAAATPKVVFNPYSKKKSVVPVSATGPTMPSALQAPRKPTSEHTNTKAAASNPYGQGKRTQHEQAQRKPQRRLPPPPVSESTTFSQAFGDADPDAHFGEEERAQQIAFDEELASAGNSGNGESIGNSKIDVRDNHKALQPHMLHVSTRQRGNPILAHIRNVPYQFSTMVPDYIFAPTRCALFLSLRYHNLHPNYIHRRVAELKSDFEYRMILCHVDIDDNTSPILFLNDLCVQNNLILMLAWSEEEAARYLETVKAFDGKGASSIQKREFATHIEQVTHALNSVRSVNKTDATQLLTQFGCWTNLATASVEELSVCPGVGPKKVKRLREVFHRPFSTEMAKRRKQREKEKQDKELKEGGGTTDSIKDCGAEGDKKNSLPSKK